MRESKRAKRLSIKVFPRGRVEVVAPRRTRPDVVRAFVDEHRAWIEEARAALAVDHPPESFELPTQIALPAIGRSVRLRYVRRREATSVRYRCSADPEASGEVLTLTGRTGDDEACVAALRRWLAATAREAFAPRLEALSLLTESPFDKMHIRAQRSCWGSRSSSGTISLNLCLLFVTPEQLRYLLIHELCHGHHMNHSRRFWARVARFEPDYRRLDRELGDAWRQVPGWLNLF